MDRCRKHVFKNHKIIPIFFKSNSMKFFSPTRIPYLFFSILFLVSSPWISFAPSYINEKKKIPGGDVAQL